MSVAFLVELKRALTIVVKALDSEIEARKVAQ